MRAILVSVMIACASLPAAADAGTPEAKLLFERGVQALAAQHWLAAEALLRRSVELAPRASSLYNLALALCELERHVECAEVAARVAADEASSYREHAARLRERALAAVGQLTLTVEPTHALVRIDAGTLDGGEVRSVLLEPGRHVVRAEAQGHLPQELAFEIAAGQQSSRRLALPRLQPPAAAPAARLAAEPGPNVAAWVASGAGVLLLSAALVTGLMAADADHDFVVSCGGTRGCDPALRPVQARAQSLALATDVLLVLGVASAGTGVTLWLLGTGSEQPRELGLRWSGRF